MAHLNAELKRVLLEGVDVAAPDQVHHWVQQAVHGEVLSTGNLGPRLYFFGDGFVEVVDLTEVSADEEVLTAVFLQLGDRPEIVRRVRIGSALLAGDRGPLRAACLLDADDQHWTLQWRQLDGTAFVGRWNTEEGEGSDALRPEVRSWLDAGDVEVDALLGDVRPVDPPEVRAAFLDYQGQVPATAEELCSLATWITAPDLLDPDGAKLIILVFGEMIEQWEVSGDLPCTVDDLVRNISSQGESKGVAVVRLGAADVDGQTRQVVWSRVEAPSVQYEAVHPVVGDTLIETIPQDPGPSRWLGHEPEVELEMPVIGVDGWAGPVAES